jgi:hypothetical protein
MRASSKPQKSVLDEAALLVPVLASMIQSVIAFENSRKKTCSAYVSQFVAFPVIRLYNLPVIATDAVQ